MIERVKVLFDEHSRGAKKTALHGGPDLPIARERELGKLWPTVDPQHISRLTEAKDLIFCVLIGLMALTKSMQK